MVLLFLLLFLFLILIAQNRSHVDGFENTININFIFVIVYANKINQSKMMFFRNYQIGGLRLRIKHEKLRRIIYKYHFKK